MKTHAQDASRLKVLHQLGIVSGQQVIAWADHVIAESAKPDSTLIDLSLTAPDSAYDIDQILGILSAERDIWETMDGVLPEIRARCIADRKFAPIAARFFYSISVQKRYSVPERFSYFMSADDDFDLAESGVLRSDEVYERFIEDLKNENGA
jgi:hypothetical protein